MPGAPVAVIEVPGSKSVAIRALCVAALARGRSTVDGAPASDDIRAVVRSLRRLGVRIGGSPGGRLVIHGAGPGGMRGGEVRLDLGGSATGLRVLAAVAALRPGETVLDGDASLRRRPAGAIVESLRALGARVSSAAGRPPLRVRGPLDAEAAARGIAVDASGSSQAVSALLLVGAALPGGIRLRLKGAVVSAPYVDLTVDAIAAAGGDAFRRGRRAGVRPRPLRRLAVRVEADWSSAAFPLVGAAILGRSVRVPGLRADSRQADRAILGILGRAGARCGVDGRGAWCRGTGQPRAFRADLRDAPDLAPAAAALALFAPGTSRVCGAAHLRSKESDRIAACVAAVRALGGRAEERADGFSVRGGTPRSGTVDPRGDHRVALAFLVAAAAIPGARLADPRCVSKSWPGARAALAPLLRAAAVSLPRRGRRG